MKKNKLKIFLIVFIVILLVVVLGSIIYYKNSLKQVSNEDEKVIIEIPENSGIPGIAKILKENGLIKNDLTFKIYCKLNNKTNMQAGKYQLSKNMDVEKITEELESGNVFSEEVTITFLEGKNMRWIAKKIAENTVNTEEDVYKLLEDEDYIDGLIENYWFLTDEIKNDDIYYPLEGYLFPDTYTFENKEISVKIIFSMMLNKMNSVLKEYEVEIRNSDYTVHELLSLSSIVELEGVASTDRSKISRVFYNRLKENMPLQSDVTTYYAFKIDMGERDLTTKEINTNNPYNTRSYSLAGKLPVGPICSPSKSAIEATINPSTDKEVNEALFFVADKNGKVYFSDTNEEHEEIISELKEKGLWYEYE